LQRVIIKPGDLNSDLILITHDHEDHLDLSTIFKINRHNGSKFAGPSSVCRKLIDNNINKKRIIKIDRGKSIDFKGIKITATFAKHTSDSVGYLISFKKERLYITGDTEYDSKLEKIKSFKPHIVFVCINGRYGNMNIREATELSIKLNPKIVIPMHYGMFKENTADPYKFKGQIQKNKKDIQVKILGYCKTYTISDKEFLG
jgi:L-ascorbate 6-phosphate lactonase